MNRKLKFFIFLCFIFGCTGYIPPKYDLNVYKNSEKAYDLEFYWNIDKGESQILINGLIKNVRYYDIRSFLLNIEIFDEKGGIISKGNFDYRHDKISTDEIIPFSVKLSLTPNTNPKKIKFSYRYFFSEDNKFRSESMFWSFEREL
ncbi:MAG: hypothetical protein N2202_08465 [Proteobacteria bacterium]|nr:hypothetical protein [Pseudomonadota bacterium]